MRTVLALILFGAQALRAAETADVAVGKLLDRIVERERVFLVAIATRTPLAETYIQETLENGGDAARPTKDHYFLGRFSLGGTVSYETLVVRTDAPPRKSSAWLPFRSGSPKSRAITFLPRG